MDSGDMRGKVCLVTGANAGLGKATVLRLAKLGASVIMVSRSRERGEAARRDIIGASGNTEVDLLVADLSSQAQIRRLAEDFRTLHSRLDVLVNNVGGVFMTRSLSADGIETSLALNHLAPFLLTSLLLDVVQASAPARIVNVTTRLGANTAIDFDDIQFEQRAYSGFSAYSETKLANMLFTYELARRLQGTGVTVNCVHPGVFRSNFGSEGMPPVMRILNVVVRPFMAEAARAAERVVYAATAPELAGVSGQYLGNRQPLTSPKQAYDEAAQARLWQLSVSLTGL
ncbi:MAG: SDR family oxidoreductase [Anaerolineae bacterium]|nr:SDR family oxidoreductase [Anaerolineae bacterium]